MGKDAVFQNDIFKLLERSQTGCMKVKISVQYNFLKAIAIVEISITSKRFAINKWSR